MPEGSGLGKRIRELRKKEGLNQDDLAEAVGVHLNTISRWENNDFTPRASDVTKLAAALHVTEAELLNGPSEDTREIKLILDKEGEFSMQMFNMVNMSAAGADQRLVCVSRDKITTGFSITTAGLDKDTARRLFMDEVNMAFEDAWGQQEKWRAEHSPVQKD